MQWGMLSFQKLDVYRCSIEFLALAAKLLADLPKGNAILADQLRRAAISMPLNIAEGAGRPSDVDAARHYGIARGSAMEAAAAIDAMKVLDVITPPQHAEAIGLLERIVSMLTKMT